MPTPPVSPRAALANISCKAVSAQLRPPTERPDTTALFNRVRGEFHEMPGLSLSLAQAARLFGLSEAECLQVLCELLDSDLLHVRNDGRYAAKVTAA